MFQSFIEAFALLAFGFAVGWGLKAALDWFRGYNAEFAKGQLAFEQDYTHDRVAQRVAELTRDLPVEPREWRAGGAA